MDDIVKQALAKWPHVPDCWGWLGLDMRGNWWLRDADTQAQGLFPHSKGSRLEHEKLLAFIGRDYEATAQGHWFFQNGPQRVYVELKSPPMVWRVHAGCHGGRAHRSACAAGTDNALWMSHGHVYLMRWRAGNCAHPRRGACGRCRRGWGLAAGGCCSGRFARSVLVLCAARSRPRHRL